MMAGQRRVGEGASTQSARTLPPRAHLRRNTVSSGNDPFCNRSLEVKRPSPPSCPGSLLATEFDPSRTFAVRLLLIGQDEDAPVRDGVVERAAYNNAVWCDAVCWTHSGPGEFARDYWLSRHAVPDYYPDLVTLTGAANATQQIGALAALMREAPGRSLSVKDSFGCLNLRALGFAPLFNAQWLFASELGALGSDEADNARWVSINDDADLARWEQAWRPSRATASSARFGRTSCPGPASGSFTVLSRVRWWVEAS